MSTETTETTEAAEQPNEAQEIVLSQGIEGPSEAELMGEDVNSETVTEETETKDDDDGKEADKETETKETDETTEKTPANSEPKVEEPPKGMVPLAAVHEARGEIKYLKEQLAAVQDQQRLMQQQQTKPKEDEIELDDFEVLTEDEFDDLAEDNPAQAAIYLRKLNIHESNQRAKAEDERRQVEFEKAYDNIIDASVAEIEKVVPGIYKEDSEVKKELMSFAEDIGFSEDLFYLTDPATKIILPGESEPLLLGEQAASILSVLVNAKSKSTPPDTTEIENKLREEITAEVMKKFKETNTGNEYRSLSQASKSDGGAPVTSSYDGKVLTTEQLQKLSEAEYERYLAGN